MERSAEGQGYLLKPLKQKLFCDGVCYLLQELYGIENKQAAVSIAGSTSESTSSTERTSDKDDSQQSPANFPASDDCNAECVICMSELRDTLILPCRHLCLCCTCAETLRYKVSILGGGSVHYSRDFFIGLSSLGLILILLFTGF